MAAAKESDARMETNDWSSVDYLDDIAYNLRFWEIFPAADGA